MNKEFVKLLNILSDYSYSACDSLGFEINNVSDQSAIMWEIKQIFKKKDTNEE